MRNPLRVATWLLILCAAPAALAQQAPGGPESPAAKAAAPTLPAAKAAPPAARAAPPAARAAPPAARAAPPAAKAAPPAAKAAPPAAKAAPLAPARPVAAPQQGPQAPPDGGAIQPGKAMPGAVKAEATELSPSAEEAEANDMELRDAPTFADPISKALEPRAGGLTANDVARRAVASSDSIAAKHAEIEAAAAQVDQAIAQFLPQLTLSATYTRLSDINNSLGQGALVGARSPGAIGIGSCADPTDASTCAVVDGQGDPIGAQAMSFPTILDNYSLKAALTVPLSDYILRLSDSIATTKHNEQAAKFNEQAEHRKVVADSRITFYNWARGLGQVAVAQKSLERIQARLKDAQVAYQLGSATRADVLRLDALVASTESAIVQTESFRDLTSAQLATLMDDRQSNYELGETILTPLPPPRGTNDLQGLVAEAEANRPELQAISESSEALRRSARVMRRGRWPRLDAFGEYNYANPNQRQFPSSDQWTGTWAVGAALTWRVNDAFNNGAIAHELDAKRKGVESQQRALREGIRMEVTGAFLDDRKARAALAAAQRGAESARAAYEVATELYRVGRATTTELIDSEADLVGALIGLVNAYIDLRVAATKVAYVTGRDMNAI